MKEEKKGTDNKGILRNKKKKVLKDESIEIYRERIGPLFAQVRRDLGWKGFVVTDSLKVTQQQLSLYERNALRIETVLRLCKVYDLEPSLVFKVVLDRSISVHLPIRHLLVKQLKEQQFPVIPLLEKIPQEVDMERIKLLFKRLRIDVHYGQTAVGAILDLTQQEVAELEKPNGPNVKAGQISKVCETYQIDPLIFYSLAACSTIDFTQPVWPLLQTMQFKLAASNN